jgi:hypothetical protein
MAGNGTGGSNSTDGHARGGNQDMKTLAAAKEYIGLELATLHMVMNSTKLSPKEKLNTALTVVDNCYDDNLLCVLEDEIRADLAFLGQVDNEANARAYLAKCLEDID